MTTAFKDLSIDVDDPVVVGSFWAAALGQELEVLDDGDVLVSGPNLVDLWISRVPEPKAVKNRVHLDLHVPEVDRLVQLGARVTAEHAGWTVLEDPEGDELCAFPSEVPRPEPAEVFALCVDSARPVELAAWWQAQLGGELGPGPDGRPRWLHGARGLGSLVLKFVDVADERVVKNRSHWDVTTDALDGLLAAGATVVAEHPRWTVLADPDGNEFCAFVVEPGS